MRYFAIFFLFIFVYFVSADEAAELQKQIELRNANIKAIEAEIAKFQAEADKTSKQAQTLANTIKTLQANGKKLDSDIKLTEAKIAKANTNIKKLSLDIYEKEQRISKSRIAISENIRLLDERDSITPIQSFLGSKNIGDSWVVISELLGLQTSIRSHIANLNGTKIALIGDKEKTEEVKTNLENFTQNLTDQKKVVAANTAEKNNILKETKNQEATYQSLVAQKKAAKAALEKEIFEYESKLKYILDPGSIPEAGSSPFSWPTDDVYITQQFGRTSASGRLYASGTHNGLDLKALLGTPIKAMADGIISGTGDTDLTCPRASFGKWILIKHDNKLAATFAHLSVVLVKAGQRVKRGDIIGYSGNSGYSTGPHLHISVYPNDAVNAESRPSAACGGKTYYMPIAAVNAYLDPLLYLPGI